MIYELAMALNHSMLSDLKVLELRNNSNEAATQMSWGWRLIRVPDQAGPNITIEVFHIGYRDVVTSTHLHVTDRGSEDGRLLNNAFYSSTQLSGDQE